MTLNSTVRVIVWSLTGIVLLYSCYLLISILLTVCGLFPTSETSTSGLGWVLVIAGAGIGFGIGLYLDSIRWNLKKKVQDAEAKQLLKEYMDREVLAVSSIWISGYFLTSIAFALWE